MNTTTLNMTTLDGGVIIKKGTAPAPPSGESGGSSWRYFDTTKATVTQDSLPIIKMLFPLFKENLNDNLKSILCGAPPLADWEEKIVLAVATDFNLKIYNLAFTSLEELKTIEEVINGMGGVEGLEQALGFTEITEAEFYNLD